MRSVEAISTLQSLSNDGVQNKHLAKGFNICKRTVQRWKATSCSTPVQREHKLQEVHIEWLKNFVENHPACTQQQYCEQIHKTFSVHVSQSTMHRTLHDLQITRKVLTRIPVKGDIDQQKAFVKWINSRPQQHHVAIDEAAIVMPFSPKYGYALKNKRAPLCNDSLSRKRLSLIAALSSKYSNPVYRLLDQNVDSSQIQAFMEYLPTNWQRATIIADNASVHKCLSSTCTQVKYLPTYSPQLNPVELYFQNVKGQLRRSSARSEEIVRQILNNVDETVRGPACFKHCFHSERVACPKYPK